jgi:hypothetical protein
VPRITSRRPARTLSAAIATALLAATPAAAQAATVPATPIAPSGPQPTLPAYQGAPFTPRAVPGVRAPWQHPRMAPNPKNGVHNDAWQTDNYPTLSGPVGRNPQTLSTSFGRTCITLTFDRRGRIIGSCTNLPQGPALYLLDPVTLDQLAFLQLPYVPAPAGTNPALNTTGGAYFYLDDKDRVVLATGTRRIIVVRVNDSGPEPRFEQVAQYDPSPCLQDGERMPSALPDAQGRLWFVGRTKGTIGVLDRRTGRCASILTNEEIENSFAVASDGIYVVSDKAMYKLTAGRDLKPRIRWRQVYRNSGIFKTGQINTGSGTTPTLIWPTRRTKGTAPGFVAITDNADPMNVVVYRTANRLRRGERRRVCEVPVFRPGASATENSLISIGRSILVENNFGYDLQQFNDIIAGGVRVGGDLNKVSEPGIARIDINARGTGCRAVWRNSEVRAPSVVPKGNSRTGQVYVFENLPDPAGADPWYWTSLDFRTGKVAWRQRAGHGGLYNNHYAGIALGRNPQTKRTTLYLGGVGGVMALRDGPR